jgi:hypothetical protein
MWNFEKEKLIKELSILEQKKTYNKNMLLDSTLLPSQYRLYIDRIIYYNNRIDFIRYLLQEGGLYGKF